MADLNDQEREYDALFEVVRAHKTVIAAVTPGHPDCLLHDREAYGRVFSGWHLACDKAAQALKWPHRDEVAREAGKEGGVIR